MKAIGETADAAAGARPLRVVITGFMAAGKTTIARALAGVLGCQALDTDEQIAERCGRTPAAIIDAEGEARFRELESAVLRDALAGTRPLVVALGGGAWSLKLNRELIERAGCRAVWLDAPFELCWQRIEAARATTDRPLARDVEAARALYESRRGLYALAAHRVEVSATATPEKVAGDIANLVRRTQHSEQSQGNMGRRKR